MIRRHCGSTDKSKYRVISLVYICILAQMLQCQRKCILAYPERDFSSTLHIPREIYNRRYPSPSTIFKNRSFHPTPPLYTVLHHHIFNSETDLTLFRIINRVVFKRECMWHTIIYTVLNVRVINVHLSLPTMFINQSLRFYYALIFVFNMRAKISMTNIKI